MDNNLIYPIQFYLDKIAGFFFNPLLARYPKARTPIEVVLGVIVVLTPAIVLYLSLSKTAEAPPRTDVAKTPEVQASAAPPRTDVAKVPEVQTPAAPPRTDVAKVPEVQAPAAPPRTDVAKVPEVQAPAAPPRTEVVNAPVTLNPSMDPPTIHRSVLFPPNHRPPEPTMPPAVVESPRPRPRSSNPADVNLPRAETVSSLSKDDALMVQQVLAMSQDIKNLCGLYHRKGIGVLGDSGMDVSVAHDNLGTCYNLALSIAPAIPRLKQLVGKNPEIREALQSGMRATQFLKLKNVIEKKGWKY